jgi:hypothetical protein
MVPGAAVGAIRTSPVDPRSGPAVKTPAVTWPARTVTVTACPALFLATFAHTGAGSVKLAFAV